MTRILLNDARLTCLKPIEYWLGRLHSSVVSIEQHVRNICSHKGAHPEQEALWTKRRDGIIDPNMRSSHLVREGDGLPLRIDPALPTYPPVPGRCAADLAGRKSS